LENDEANIPTLLLSLASEHVWQR
jgi:hypothetical protein